MSTTLKIYRATSGQWSGTVTEITVTDNEKEEAIICGVAGCNSPEEAEQAIYDTGTYPDEITVEN